MDLKLTGGDLTIVNGDLALVVDTDAITQQVQISLRTFLGEWYRDPTVGMPYFTQVLIKSPDEAVIESLFRRACLAVPGVLDVIDLQLGFDRANRKLAVQSLRLAAADGTLIDFPPFVVGGGQ